MFDAYGLELSTPAAGDPFGFGALWGYYTDRETGLSLLTHRYYDPHLARFLTRDPSGYAAGLNLYAYAGNNPASYTDPDGHFWFLFTGAAGAGLGAIVGGGVAWWNGDNIWIGAGKGFLLGGIAGLTGGLAGEAVAGWIGGTAIANGAISGFVGGVVGDSAQQGDAILLGWRDCFSIPEALASGAVGGVLGGAGGWWAESRGSMGGGSLPVQGVKVGKGGLAADMESTAYRPGQYGVSASKIDALVDLMKSPVFEWSSVTEDEPILVDDNGVIRQGHHRIVAAQCAGIAIPEGVIGRGTTFVGKPIGWGDVWVLK
jgi:RHS repeat-associated protein